MASFLMYYIRTRLRTTLYTYRQFLTCILMLVSSIIWAQSQNKTNTVYPNQKLDEANKQALKNPSQAFDLATEALELSFETKNKKAEASAYNTLGTLYYNTGDYSQAVNYFTKAKTIYEKVTDTKNEEYALKYLAMSYEALNQTDKSISYYSRAEQKTTSPKDKADYKLANSKVKKSQGKNKEAIADLEQELYTNKSISPKQKIDIYLELGDLYLATNEKEKGIQTINKAIEESQKTKTTSADTLSISTLNYAWTIYDKNGLTSENIVTQQRAYTTAQSINNIELSNAATYNMGLSYIESNPKKAIQYFEANAKNTRNKPTEKDHIRAIEKLSEAYEKSGEYDKALEKYKEYVKLVDSIKASEMESKLTNELLSAKYKVQENKIKELETKQIEREKAIIRQRNTILTLTLGLVLFGLLTYLLVKNIKEKQKSNMVIQLASLRSQMNPHFIFNSLNSVNGFISNNDEVKANRYISDFSKLMRSVLNNSNNETISLQEELKTLQIYLALEHSRFEDKFDYDLTVDTDIDLEQTQVPPMLIQPYIENAVWHGLRYKENKGHLSININKHIQGIEVIIKDNGIGRKKSEELKTNHQRDYKSTGIRNTKERINLLNKLYKTNFQVLITDLTEDNLSIGTQINMILPTLNVVSNAE